MLNPFLRKFNAAPLTISFSRLRNILFAFILLLGLAHIGFALVPPKAGVPGEYQGSTAAGSYPFEQPR